MKRLFALLLLLVSPAAFSQVGGYVHAGFSLGTFTVESSNDVELDLEDGAGYNITTGLRFHPGLEARLSYVHLTHDGGELRRNGKLFDVFKDDATIDDLRIGLFYAPPQKGTLGFRVGGGYVIQGFEIVDETDEESDGLFLEGSMLINAGKFVTIDIGAAYLKMEDQDEGDKTGFEMHGMLFFHAGPVDIGVGFRGLAVNAEYENGYALSEQLGDYRLTIGGSWGYPKAKRQ